MTLRHTFPIREIPYFGVPVDYISAFIVIIDMRAEFSVKRYLNIKLSVLFVYNNLIHQHSEMRITYRTVGYNTVKYFALKHSIRCFICYAVPAATDPPSHQHTEE